MDAYNYNSLIRELCLLPNKNLDLQSNQIPEVKSITPIPEVKPIQSISPIKKISSLDQRNYTIIEPIKPLQTLVKRQTIQPLVMKGGSVNLDFSQIISLVYNNPTQLKIIIKFYYDNYNQLINSKQIINVLISIIYNEFTDPELSKELTTIITPEYIKTIPEEYIFNFHDKVMGDLLKECADIKERFKILDENIDLLQNTNLSQKGGKKSNKRIDVSNDKTVEEKIKNNINTLTTFLKSKSMKLSQKGGAITLADMFREITIFNSLTPDQKKDKTNIRKTEEKSNMWVVELLIQKLVTKVIKDDNNIARYFLEKNPTAIDPNMDIIIDFVNDHASMLTLKNTDRIKIDIPNLITVNSYGTAKPTRITDKLREYFNKKYDELVKIRSLGESKESNKPTEPLEKIQFLLSQKGGLSGTSQKDKKLEKQIEETFEEKCFTSRQLSKFLKKVSSYLRSTGKVIDDSDITRITNDIENLKKIEAELVKNYTIFANYIKIQEVYPDTSAKEITINHMRNVIDNNKQLFDSYGNINTELLDVINKVERYSNLKEYTEMVDMTKELNQLSQTGGKSFSANKSYLKFNVQNDIEHFTSRSFQKIIGELGEKSEDD